MMATTSEKKEYIGIKIKQRQLESSIYEKIKSIFVEQRISKAHTGKEDGISDSFLIYKIFKTKHPHIKQVKIIKKLRRKYQSENKRLVGAPNESGEYLRFHPKKEIELDNYADRRKPVIVGNIKSLMLTIKANAYSLGYDWHEKCLDLINDIEEDGNKYLEDKSDKEDKHE
jgi:hypothetical protein